MSEPDKIYLQPPGSGEEEHDRTWCADRIDEDLDYPDTEYVRLDLYTAEVAKREEAEKAAKGWEKIARTAFLCDTHQRNAMVISDCLVCRAEKAEAKIIGHKKEYNSLWLSEFETHRTVLADVPYPEVAKETDLASCNRRPAAEDKSDAHPNP